MLVLDPKIPFVALLALIVAAVLVGRWRIVRKAPLHPLDFAWLLPAVAALVAAISWVGGGLYESTDDALAIYLLTIAALGEGACALARRPVLDALDVDPEAGRPARLRGEAARAGIAVAALLGSCALSWVALELPWNSEILQIEAVYTALELTIILGLLTLLYFAFQRRGAGIAIGSVALCLVGIAQFFVARFKAAGIMPGDLLALGTAAEVSGGYTYSVNNLVVVSVCCALVACGLCAFVAPSRPRTREGLFGNVMGNVIALLVVGSLMWSGSTISIAWTFGTWVNYWDSLSTYRSHGFLPAFLMVLQDMPIARPEGYSDESAAQIEAGYVADYEATTGASARRAAAEQQFNETKPSIVCIMNESFSDLSIFDGLRSGYEGPAFYKSWQDTVLRGDLAVTVQGGGTCNTEFEFLTGVSLSYVGAGKYPYTLYELSSADSLPRQLSEQGYATTAIHPNLATNWNRKNVYNALGFDEFLDIDDFDEDAPRYHNGITDAATYDKVLEVLRESDDPQFIFAVTMQNHSGYNNGDIPADQLRNYAPEGLDANNTAALNEYLACIDASDRDLQYLVEQLQQLGRPVVLVFFGDHQPNFTPAIAQAFYPNADDLTRAVMTYQATYAVWANYPLATGDETADAAGGAGAVEDAAVGAAGVEGTAADAAATTTWDYTSPSYLAAMTLDVAGAPLTDFQKAQLAMRSQIPALSGVGTRLADGTWISSNNKDAMPQAYDDFAQITYLEFARKVE